MRIDRVLVALLCLAVIPVRAGGAAASPNVVILLADDVGLMDFGIYGGEARTPNIDALARRGALFTRFRSSPQCAPSRAMLLTGMDNHQSGLGAIPEVLPPSHVGRPGYTMHLEPGVETLASRLKAAGYRTLMTGKWHLGHGPGDLPDHHGFDRSFVLDASGADNFADQSYMPLYDEAPWFEDGRPADLPEDFYSSEFLVDRMIEYLGEDPAAQGPFLAYVAFQAIHIPVQAPRAFIERYDGVYDAGWDALRRDRWQRAARLGLIPEGAPLAAMHSRLRRWDALDADERALATREMQVNAGMLDAMDHHIGRLIDHLRRTGVYDDTIFVVTSDNGPEGADPTSEGGAQAWLLNLWLRTHGYEETAVEALGGPGTWVAIGPEWASAAASPSNLFKFHGADGALRVPLILAGPGVPSGVKLNAFSIMPDLMPTLLDLVGVPIPEDGARPITGRSLQPALADREQQIYGPEELVGVEVAGNVALYKGRYKLVRNLPPLGDRAWHVYDLRTDPGESQDLSLERPELLDSLLEDYRTWSAGVGVIEMPEDYAPLEQVARNLGPILIERYALWMAAGGLLLLALGFAGFRAYRWIAKGR